MAQTGSADDSDVHDGAEGLNAFFISQGLNDFLAGRISLGLFCGEGLNGFLIREGLNGFLASDLALRSVLGNPARRAQVAALAFRCGSGARRGARSCQRTDATIPKLDSLYRFAKRAYNDMDALSWLFTLILARKLFSDYFELFLNRR